MAPCTICQYDSSDESCYAALFNLSDEPKTLSIPLEELGITGTVIVCDLWEHKDIGAMDKALFGNLPAHGAVLFRLKKSLG